MIVAESLVDYRRETPPSLSHHPRVTNQGGGDKDHAATLLRKDQAKALVQDKRKEFTPRTNCFLCKKARAQASKEGGWLKAVNSAAKPSHGVARGVTMHIGSWEGRVNFTVAPMDDFKMVLGMDFLQKVKPCLTFPALNGYLEEEKP
ncbi:hypothetical protein CK203_050921 [Vitis vinifera]|uniref:Uncharacterized protein n=1 Tax=Vitis vinifera TaxID=29760 RepID=A0A438GQW0_VITVI|nr:hypothetical protein CK203_050921 [Vitis vinifera]